MKVCFLGLGSMGSGVCRNLLNKGYALQVWNRSPEKDGKGRFLYQRRIP